MKISPSSFLHIFLSRVFKLTKMQKSKRINPRIAESIENNSLEEECHDENTSTFIEERLLQNKVLKKLIDQIKTPLTPEIKKENTNKP